MQLERAVKSDELNPVQPLAKHLPPQTIPFLLLGLVASKYVAVISAAVVRRGRVAG